MGNPIKGEIWWASNLSAGNGTVKDRPVLIWGMKGADYICFKITSQSGGPVRKYEILDTSLAGLEKNSYLLYDQVVLTRKRLTRKLGNLSSIDQDGFIGRY